MNMNLISWWLVPLGWVPLKFPQQRAKNGSFCQDALPFGQWIQCHLRLWWKQKGWTPANASFGLRLNPYDIGFWVSRWWFQIICFFNVHPMWRRFPCWLMFFKWVGNHQLGFRWISQKNPALLYFTSSYKGLNMMFMAGHVANPVISQILQTNCIWIQY